MTFLKILSASEQVAAHIKRGLLRRRWTDEMPGVPALAKELGVNHNTVKAAPEDLEKEGLLENQGAGRRRRIVLPKNSKAQVLKIAILRYAVCDETYYYAVDYVNKLRAAGHEVTYTKKTLCDLKEDISKISEIVQNTDADAWIVVSGHKKILDWFSKQPLPVFGLFGTMSPFKIAGAGPKTKAVQFEILNRLLELGHRRISLISQIPLPNHQMAEKFVAWGIPPSPFSLPQWQDQPGGLVQALESLFALTPPTALIIDETKFLNATLLFLTRHGIQVPDQVSIVALDPDPDFELYQPGVAHIQWEASRVVQRIVRWADNIAKGLEDTKQLFVKASFVEGQTIGPAPKH